MLEEAAIHFGTDGWRGQIAEDYTFANVRRCGQGFAAYLIGKGWADPDRLACMGWSQVVYKGFGHGITKPKAMRAVMQHNLAWFGHYVFGDPPPDLTAPDVPKQETPAEK